MDYNLDKITGREITPEEERESQRLSKWKKSGIYAIMVDNKVLYIGQSVNMWDRIHQHMSYILKPHREKKYQLFHIFNLYGKKIEFEVLEYVNPKELDEREAYYINHYLPPLNRNIPKHKDFEKQNNLLSAVSSCEDAMRLAKKRD